MGNRSGNTFSYFTPLFKFLESVTNSGGNVMVHCLAGAHRAGTSSIAWLMYADGHSANQAIKKAQSKRKDLRL